MKINYKELGKRIKTKRLELGYTQAELAEICDISNVYVSYVERGCGSISLEALYAISIALGVTPDFLLMDSIYTSQEYIRDDIALLLKDCTPENLKLIKKLISTVVECAE